MFFWDQICGSFFSGRCVFLGRSFLKAESPPPPPAEESSLAASSQPARFVKTMRKPGGGASSWKIRGRVNEKACGPISTIFPPWVVNKNLVFQGSFPFHRSCRFKAGIRCPGPFRGRTIQRPSAPRNSRPTRRHLSRLRDPRSYPGVMIFTPQFFIHRRFPPPLSSQGPCQMYDFPREVPSLC